MCLRRIFASFGRKSRYDKEKIFSKIFWIRERIHRFGPMHVTMRVVEGGGWDEGSAGVELAVTGAGGAGKARRAAVRPEGP
jgi:hypothetical protein